MLSLNWEALMFEDGSDTGVLALYDGRLMSLDLANRDGEPLTTEEEEEEEVDEEEEEEEVDEEEVEEADDVVVVEQAAEEDSSLSLRSPTVPSDNESSKWTDA